MPWELLGFDHVQLAMPPGGEGEAEEFYCGVLGFLRQPKPATLAARGGCWFARGEVQLHLGVESDFRPARKAHPALRVHALADLVTSIEAAGHPFRWDSEMPGVRRGYTEKQIEQLWSGNLLRVMEEVEKAAKKIQATKS